MERQARAAGARFEVRDGWNVAVSYAARRAALRDVGVRGRVAPAQVRDAGRPPPALELRPRHRRRRQHLAADDARRARSSSAARPPAGALDVTTAFARAPARRPARPRDVRALHGDRPAPAGHAGPATGARLGRAHARRDPLRGRGPLPDAVRLRARPVRLDRRGGRRRATSAAARSATTRSCGRPRVLDIFRKRRMWRPRPGPQEALRRRHRRRRRARPRDRVLPQAARHHRRRGAREELHRLGRGRPQHDDPALELQDAGGRALLRRLGEALRGPAARN